MQAKRSIKNLLMFGVFLTLLFPAALFAQQRKQRGDQFLVVLGTAQDAGYPQIGCERDDCIKAQRDRRLRQTVVSLGLVDRRAGKKWLVEATPDIGEQLFLLNSYLPAKTMMPDGVFLTHAHIGHYTGLMYFGREAAGASKIPVYAMPKMRSFLIDNAPWSQLVKIENIVLKELEHDQPAELASDLTVRPFLVPHRDEFSETVGFEIAGRRKKALFIPDIDKWSKWDRDLKELVRRFDHLFLDATFFENGEIPNRDMSEIPHPFVSETVNALKDLTKTEKKKVVFIHFNHTNPLLDDSSQQYRSTVKAGFTVARAGMTFEL